MSLCPPCRDRERRRKNRTCTIALIPPCCTAAQTNHAALTSQRMFTHMPQLNHHGGIAPANLCIQLPWPQQHRSTQACRRQNSAAIRNFLPRRDGASAPPIRHISTIFFTARYQFANLELARIFCGVLNLSKQLQFARCSSGAAARCVVSRSPYSWLSRRFSSRYRVGSCQRARHVGRGLQ